jgi:hypothetical protein
MLDLALQVLVFKKGGKIHKMSLHNNKAVF